MKLLDKLERKFGFLAIKGLMTYIIGATGLVYILMLSNPQNISKLVLEPSLVMQGEVWRLFSYIFIPPATSPFWIIFILYFYYMVGSGLEREWGSFKFNLYYLIGMVATTIAVFAVGGMATAVYLNLALFLAFAHLYPDFEILLFFILPLKVKYLAWFNWGLIGFTVLFEPPSYKVMAAASVVNYFIFFGKDLIARNKTTRQSYQNRKRFMGDIPTDITIHRCTTCGMTEKDDKKMEFRYCSTCEGDYEYCMNHLKTHTHIASSEKSE